ncbi:hypothetical protein FRC00_006563 [Tulasnella sp. 408]|nr:hypothetical protein FRC00_006563 [Tulasnella sp. 408]
MGLAMSEPYKRRGSNSQKTTHAVPPPPESTSPENRSTVEKRFLAPGVTLGPLEDGDVHSRLQQDSLPRSINDLPTELLTRILHVVLNRVIGLPEAGLGIYLKTLKNLALVCLRWKSIIRDTPTFWAVIDSKSTTREMQYMLRKSRNCPLTFRHVGRSVGSDFADFARLNMARCFSLSFTPLQASQAAHLLEYPAPTLREATVVASICDIIEPLALFNGQAGALEDLTLERIPIRWDSGLPPMLRRLEVSCKTGVSGWFPHPPTIVAALSGCIGIEVVRLSGLGMLEHSDWEWPEVQESPVELPMLKDLRIENMGVAKSGGIVGSLRAPALRNLWLKESHQVDSVVPLLHTPNPLLLQSIQRALARCDRIVLVVGKEDFTFNIQGEEGQVHLAIGCRNPDELGSWLAEKFASELVLISEVRLVGGSALPGQEFGGLRKLLEALNNVAVLICPYVEPIADALVKHLALPYREDDDLRWHCPELRHIRFDDAHKWPELALTMFRERYEPSQKEDEEPGLGTPKLYPCPLDTLQLGGMKSKHPETFQEIARIVGEEVLVCGGGQ